MPTPQRHFAFALMTLCAIALAMPLSPSLMLSCDEQAEEERPAEREEVGADSKRETAIGRRREKRHGGGADCDLAAQSRQARRTTVTCPRLLSAATADQRLRDSRVPMRT